VSEKLILSAVDQLLERLAISGTRFIFFGESLGSAVATYAAQNPKTAGVILQAPFTSLSDVGQSHYPYFPVHLLSRHTFPAASWAENVRAPTLVLRAEFDRTIPPFITDKQIERFSPPPEVILFRGAGHNNMRDDPSGLYWKSVRAFVARLTKH
jgi:pimeloyl-ACP methyl ester carboxylesterase